MIDREAKRLALTRIIGAAESAVFWSVHPESGASLSHADREQLREAGEAILAVMRRRAQRLRSIRSG